MPKPHDPVSLDYLDFRVWGRRALFTDPSTKLGGEKLTLPIPTYEALIGIVKGIYWKPTIVWVIDQVRVMNRIRTHSEGVRTIHFGKAGTDRFYYTYLIDVEYQVRAHFVFNPHRPDLAKDRNYPKHMQLAHRRLDRGGTRDICLGARECQAYVEPILFGTGRGYYDHQPDISFGMMLHGFDYPDEIGVDELWTRWWKPTLRNGIIDFPSPDSPGVARKFVKSMVPIRPSFTAGGVTA
jgi:CRISPR-associated protein Cas5d